VVCLAGPIEQPFENIIVEEQLKWLAEAVAVGQLQEVSPAVFASVLNITTVISRNWNAAPGSRQARLSPCFTSSARH
jgi:hypothetical protein